MLRCSSVQNHPDSHLYTPSPNAQIVFQQQHQLDARRQALQQQRAGVEEQQVADHQEFILVLDDETERAQGQRLHEPPSNDEVEETR
eukprot:6491358-Amphidinium_carterae.8